MLIKKKVKIKNPQGLHARPASIFVKIANGFESDITVQRGSEKVNGKSIMGLLMLAASEGSIVEIETSGADADKAIQALEKFLLDEGDVHENP